MNQFAGLGIALIFLASPAAAPPRINQEGRILGPLPVVTSPILFNTIEADAIVSAMQIFPVTNPWNEDISRRPVLANSEAMIAQITADLSSTRRTLRVFKEMNFVLVPDGQARLPIDFVDYPDESDPSPYPIPSNMPIEGWPAETTADLLQWQQDPDDIGGDRHAIIVQPGTGSLWEMWQAKRLSSGGWQAANGAKFNLNLNALRPAGWTSGDAAGLAMFPAVVRYDECQRGMVEHACRIVVKRTRYHTYIYPATHYAAPATNNSPNLPAMGQRLRLKSTFVIPDSWAKEEKALLLGLKKYGALVADNGNFFSISITPDDRWPENAFSHISSIGIANFEVVQTTGPDEGPRAPGGLVANAGMNQSAPASLPVQLYGFVNYSGAPPLIQWKVYSGPGAVSFANPAQTNTTASFALPGVYTLMLSAEDGIHATAYSAAVITITNSIRLAISLRGTDAFLSWMGGSAPYVVEVADALPPVSWRTFITSDGQNLTIGMDSTQAFFRVRGN